MNHFLKTAAVEALGRAQALVDLLFQMLQSRVAGVNTSRGGRLCFLLRGGGLRFRAYRASSQLRLEVAEALLDVHRHLGMTGMVLKPHRIELVIRSAARSFRFSVRILRK